MPRGGWPEERLAKLDRLVADGLSAGQIAAQLHGVTRSAVVGMAHRRGLKLGHGRGWPPAQPRPVAAPRRGSAPRPKPKAPARPPLPAITVRAPLVFRTPQVPFEPVSRNLPLTEWTATTCKWIAGDGAAGLACGHPTDQATPYCEYHLRRSLARTQPNVRAA